MDKKHNVSDYMWWNEKENAKEVSFEEKLLGISKSVGTHIFGPINEGRNYFGVEKRDSDLIGDINNVFGNAYYKIMLQYENGEISSRFNEFFIDFKNQLKILCEKIERYINDEKYRESQFTHKIVEGLFKLNEEFYNLNKVLEKTMEQDEYWERLMNVMLYSSVNNDEMGQIHAFPYIETEQWKKRREEYEQKIDQVKHLWIGIYHFLMQLMDKELGALLANEDEESFRNWLKTSYIWERVKWVEYWENFSRSHSILKEKHEEILKQLSKLKECFDEKGNLKDGTKIPTLDDIRILEITKGDKRKYNNKQRKTDFREKIGRLLSWKKSREGNKKK